MKKTLSILLAAAVTITIVGCQKEFQPDPQRKEFEVKRLRAYGEVSPNPVNYDHCILTGYKETLESFRHVSKGRLYYMDYVAEFPFEEMIVKDPMLRYKPNEYQEMMFRLNSLLYNDAMIGEAAPHISSACSGFVCHNPQGQLLFGRNMDSGNGNLIVTFHAHQKSGYKFVMILNSATFFVKDCQTA